MTFALVVRFDLQDDAAAQLFDQLTRDVVAAVTTHEPGTLIYATHIVADEPLARIFYEVYLDEGAFDLHERAEHVGRFHRLKEPTVAASRVEFLTPGRAGSLERYPVHTR